MLTILINNVKGQLGFRLVSTILIFKIIPTIGFFKKEKNKAMAKNTSILLGDYFDNFINYQIKSGRYSSASEVIRAALRLFEKEENQKVELIKELKEGEKSGFVQKFDRTKFIKNLHDNHISDKV